MNKGAHILLNGILNGIIYVVGENAVVSQDGLSPLSCPKSMKWSEESHEKDLYIDTQTMTVLAMDGRRRWLDIKRLVNLYPSLLYQF